MALRLLSTGKKCSGKKFPCHKEDCRSRREAKALSQSKLLVEEDLKAKEETSKGAYRSIRM